MNKEDTKNKIIKILSEQLGVEPEDINENDSLESDLHMKTTELSDFIHNLNTQGFETDKIDFSVIETVIDIIYSLEGETS